MSKFQIKTEDTEPINLLADLITRNSPTEKATHQAIPARIIIGDWDYKLEISIDNKELTYYLTTSAMQNLNKGKMVVFHISNPIPITPIVITNQKIDTSYPIRLITIKLDNVITKFDILKKMKQFVLCRK